jgi:pimeloyl-ACP methyl ester carboxylesterase
MSEIAHPDSFQQALGPLRTASLSAGALRYRDHGSGVPVVFLAGLVLASGFWRRVVPALTQPVRAIVPDLPLGAHTIAMRRDADLSPIAIADLIPELLDTLDLGEAVIVGSRLPIAFGRLTKQPLDKHVYDSYLTPGRSNAGVRRDTAKVLRAIRRRYTIQADAALARFERPTLIAWASEDRVFPYRHAEALAEILPNAELIPVADSYTYIPEDQPLVLAGHLDRFIAQI